MHGLRSYLPGRGRDLKRAREKAILNLVAQVRQMEPQFHALLASPPKRAAAVEKPKLKI